MRFFLAINEDKQCLALAWKDRIDRRVNRGICLGTWAVGKCVTINFSNGAGVQKHQLSESRDADPVCCNGWFGATTSGNPET